MCIRDRYSALYKDTGGVTNDIDRDAAKDHTQFQKIDKIKKAKHHKQKEKKLKHPKDKKFEGQVRVSHLDKQRLFKAPMQDNEESKMCSASQDNYVLSKLFSKTGVHSAVQHDMIVDGGGADNAIVEAEANKLAKEAVKALKMSRRQCSRVEAGTPTWTGQNGGPKQKQRFGGKKKSGEALSSSDLLSRMKSRNMLVSSVPQQERPEQQEDDLFQVGQREEQRESVSHQDLDLLTDIRNFIAFQAKVDGEASTSELVAKFKRLLPSQQSPLFKAFLNQICSFRRDEEGKGMWRLKSEFR